jgi:DNA-binding winged helix-turn-helix (wHTH) protein
MDHPALHCPTSGPGMTDRSRPSRPEDVLIEAVLEARRVAAHLYEFGRFRLDVQDQRVTRDGVLVSLPPKEFETLRCLVEAHGRLVTKRELLTRVWTGVNVDEGTIAHRICALRKALGRDEEGREYTETVPRRGYRLTVGR